MSDEEQQPQARAVWSTAYINDLPDSAFACVDDAGRHYPHHDASGAIDEPHLANALSRVAQGGTTTCGADHLEAHARALGMGNRTDEPEDEPLDAGVVPIQPDAVQVRDAARRELDIRLMPWDVAIDTAIGLEEFRRGAFADAKPDDVLLHGMEHETFFGMGQTGDLVATRHPIGKAIALDDRPDAQYGTFRVAKTARGDEVLALAAEGLVRGASVEWSGVPGGTHIESRNGRRLTVVERARLTGASTTYRPAYEQAGVVAVRSQQKETLVSDQDPAPDEGTVTATASNGANATNGVNTPTITITQPPADVVQARAMEDLAAAFGSRMGEAIDKATGPLFDRIAHLEESARMQFAVPGEAAPKRDPVLPGHWLKYALTALSGERISTQDQQYRALADIVTSDNLGVVPDAFSTEIIGVIDPARPFMSSTRRLPTPDTGMTLHVPKIVTRPTVGIQSDEKDELTSTPTQITSESFDAVTKGGAGDLSLQILKRSSPSFLDLYMRLLAEAYAMDTELEALESLLAEGEVHDGNTLDPSDAAFGDAFVSAFDVIRRGPDTIWLSSQAVGAFIDAVNPTTGLPIYSSITADFSVPGGISGTIKGLRPVHVPEMDAAGAKVIIGPSSGFAWAEDGTYTLQVDVPARAGRDVALVGMVWFAPYYPGAFTVYETLTS